MTNKSFLFWLILIHIPLFVYQFFYGRFYLFDSQEYLWASENVFNHFTLYGGDLKETIDTDLYTKRPPLYPLFIGFNLFSPYLLILTQNILSVTGIFFLRKAIKTTPSFSFDKWFLLFNAASLSYLIYTNMVMSETILSFVLCLMVYQLSCFVRNKRIFNLLILSILLVVSMLVKPVFYPFAIVFLIVGLLYFYREITFRRVVVLMLPLLMVISVYAINKNRTGVAHFSSIKRINLLNYNVNYLLVNKHGANYADHFIDSVRSISKGEPYEERYETEMNAVKGVMENNFFEYVKFHLKGTLFFFLDPGRFDFYHFFGMEKSPEASFLKLVNQSGVKGIFEYLKEQPLVALFLLVLSMLIGVIRFCLFLLFFNPLKWKEVIKKPLLVFVGLLVFYVAFATGPLGAARFAVPVVLLMNALVALGISNRWENKKK